MRVSAGVRGTSSRDASLLLDLRALLSRWAPAPRLLSRLVAVTLQGEDKIWVKKESQQEGREGRET